MKVRKTFQALLAAALLSAAILVPSMSMDAVAQSPASQVKDGVDSISDPNNTGDDLTTTIGKIVKVFLFFVGAVAVVMIIYGGFRYVTSNGDSSGVSGAKNTLLYAVVGLVIAVSAYAIVDFVLDTFRPSAVEPGNEAGGAVRDAARDAAGNANQRPNTNTIGPAE